MSGRLWQTIVFGACNIIVVAYLAFDFSRAYSSVSAQEKTEQVASPPSAKYADEQLDKLVNLINQKRADQGLARLGRDPALDAIAEQRAQDMASKAYYAHQSPDGRFFSDLMDESNTPYNFACENLNMAEQPDPEEFYSSWLASTDHRSCLQSSSTNKAGYATTKVLVSNGIPISQHVVVAIYVQD